MEYSVHLIQPDEAGVDLFLTRYKPFRLAALQNDPSSIQKHDDVILSSVTIVRNVSVPQGVKTQLGLEADHEATQQVSHWEVNAVYTAPGARRRGLGRRVMEAAAKEAQEVADSEGKPCLITVLVKRKNAAARILYERAGFQVLGDDDGDDALRLFLWTAR
ncbi:hypothetical protein MHUMG1_02182 [Metarhizium humberi]|uniref:N-acetyltransferase domain-containing protein n=1 Tax=Metarhizium humberi TaxID=2596975 RepID=A0A9P8MJ36_9HYPO|nr:hypothetical protein MHUMG1_02182 [Metarhizium humberi]